MLKSIEDVLMSLDQIIQQETDKQSGMAYFAILYRHMTARVLRGVQTGQFENGERMVKLDLLFAQRYIDAYQAYVKKSPLTQSWQIAFDACSLNKPIVLQHLLLGINAHINLDLCIAAASTAPKDQIHVLKADFEKINLIISDLIDGVQSKLEQIWWPLRLIRRIVNDRHEAVISFSIQTARKASWGNAVALAELADPIQARETYIRSIDLGVSRIAKGILNPGVWSSMVLRIVRMGEPKNVRKIIDILKEDIPV
jgi:hypothetical protein